MKSLSQFIIHREFFLCNFIHFSQLPCLGPVSSAIVYLLMFWLVFTGPEISINLQKLFNGQPAVSVQQNANCLRLAFTQPSSYSAARVASFSSAEGRPGWHH